MPSTVRGVRLTISVAARVLLELGLVSAVASAQQAPDDPAPRPRSPVPDPQSPDPQSTDPGPRSTDAALRFFESKVRPLLIANCFECHGENQQKGGLRLDSRESALAGGDSGAAIEPGDPATSLLIEAVGYAGVYKMPPRGKLSDDEIALLSQWIRLGAPWPDSPAPVLPAPATAAEQGAVTDEQQSFWAFQRVLDPTLPAVQDNSWPQTPVDRFVLAGLEANDLRPAPPADKRTLLRRATFDLIGLPPTADEVAAFEADDSPEAFARVVDRLLASPHYGQRWGRHWLDVARYADSNGLDENLAYVNAYRYRDWVVDAFNADLPYDEFVTQQLAGDLLPASGQDRIDQARLIATGFLTVGAKMLAEDDPVKMEMDIIDEQIDAFGSAFLGLTLGCARCHDHKFDPISARDYYALAGIFRSTHTMDNFTVVATWHERPLASPEYVALVQDHARQVSDKQKSLDAMVAAADRDLGDEIRRRADQYLLAADQLLRRQDFLTSQLSAASGAAAGALIIEAEGFQRGNAKIDFEAYGKDIGVIYNAGQLPNAAEYDVEVPTDGAYQVELRYAAAESRPARLEVDGQLLHDQAAGQVTGSWNPDTQTWFAETLVALGAGKHVLKLQRDGPFPHFDRLALVPRELPPGLELADIRTSAQLAQDLELIPPVLSQFIEALRKARENAQSPLYVWYIWNQESPPADLPADASPTLAAVLAAPRPATRQELLDRYKVLFDRAIQAWHDARQADPATTALADPVLADPVLDAIAHLLFDPQGPCAPPPGAREFYPAAVKADVEKLTGEVAILKQRAPAAPDQAMAVEDRQTTNVRVHIRGSHLALGDEVPRRFPSILGGESQPPLPSDHSGRLELARWLAEPGHPLTSRVMANRVWRWHFGEALVRTPDNFGKLGERPDNAGLLDWLANRLVSEGWSLKSLHRVIMLSETYRMSTAYNEQAAEIDPDNRLLWHMNRRRLEAEAIRDSILVVSGALDRTMRGSLLKSKPREYVASTTSVNTANYETNRRSIYLPVIRSALYEMFQAFDFAEPSVPNGNRVSTTVAPQALFMMNAPLTARASRKLADELLRAGDIDDAGRIRNAYLRVYARPAAEHEVVRALAFIDRLAASWESTIADPAERRARAWQGLCRVLLSASEFVFVE